MGRRLGAGGCRRRASAWGWGTAATPARYCGGEEYNIDRYIMYIIYAACVCVCVCVCVSRVWGTAATPARYCGSEEYYIYYIY